MRMVIVRIRGERFGIPIEQVLEVAEIPSDSSRIPNAPAVLQALYAHRGRPVVGADLAALWETTPHSLSRAGQWVLLALEKGELGLLVDGVEDVLDVSIVGPPPSERQHIAKATATNGTEAFAVLEPSKIELELSRSIDHIGTH